MSTTTASAYPSEWRTAKIVSLDGLNPAQLEGIEEGMTVQAREVICERCDGWGFTLNPPVPECPCRNGRRVHVVWGLHHVVALPTYTVEFDDNEVTL